VILSRDAEGNGYSPLANFWLGSFKTDKAAPWIVEVGLTKLLVSGQADRYNTGFFIKQKRN
jgi:hypothetical protein